MATISISAYISAQGELVSRNGDIATIRFSWGTTKTGRLITPLTKVPVQSTVLTAN